MIKFRLQIYIKNYHLSRVFLIFLISLAVNKMRIIILQLIFELLIFQSDFSQEMEV